MLKIPQVRLQQYVIHELPDVQAVFRRARRTKDQIANIHWIIKKAEFQKNIYFCLTDYTKVFDCMDHNKPWKILKESGNTRSPDLPPKKSICRSRSNRTGHGTTDWFQIGKGVRQGFNCHPASLTYMQSTS